MYIKIKKTPNPNAIKFILGIVISQDKMYFFEKNGKYYKKYSKLIKILFIAVKSIKYIMIGTNFVSVTKNNSIKWNNNLIKKIKTILIDFFVFGNNIINKNIKKNIIFSISNIENKIKELIKVKVKPAVEKDGGNIVFQKYKNGNVYVKLYGACKGCPSSKITLKHGIENMLKYFIPEIKSVISYND